MRSFNIFNSAIGRKNRIPLLLIALCLFRIGAEFGAALKYR